MSNYVKSTNFTAKDSLPTGDTNKVIRGSEFDTEFNAIATAVATKSDLAGPTFTGTATFDGITATGTVNFTGGSVTTNIDGGTIDGVTIGGSTPGAGTFSSLTVTTADINAGTVDNTVIGGTTPAAGTFSSLTATTANIDGGSIDGAVIGGSTPAAISGTTGTFSGAVSGTTGTFSGAVTGSNLNVSNWDTAFGWGNHATQGYLTSVTFSDMDAGAITTSGETFTNSDTQIPTNAAVRNWVLTTYPTIVEQNNLTLNVTWANVPDANITQSSVTQHQAALSIAASQLSDVTSTAAELNVLDGITATTAELNYTDGVTSNIQTQLDSKVGANYTGDVDITGELLVDSYNETFKKVSSVGTSVGYNLSSANYDSKSFNISAQAGGVNAIRMKANGTVLFVLNFADDTIYQYSLSTPYDITTASYDSKSFAVTSQDATPRGLEVKPDGTKLYIAGDTNNTVYEYDLSTAWDISTASYSSNSFSVNSQISATAFTSVSFKSDGTSFYALAQNTGIYQYDLTTAWDVSTASYVSKSLTTSSQDTSMLEMEFATDGTKVYINGATQNVFQYNLSTAWDLSTGSYSSISFSVTSQATSPNGIAISDSGKKMYIGDSDTDAVYQYSISAITYSTTFDCENANVFETELDANTTVVFSNPPASGTPVATGYNLSGATFVDSFSVVSQELVVEDIAFNANGTKMFIVGSNGDEVNEYALSTGFDVSTTSFTQTFSVASQDTNPTAIAFNSTGTKMFIVGNANDAVFAYDLTTGFDVSTASYSSTSFSLSSQELNAKGIAFNSDGTKMFIVGESGDDVNEYNLSTGFDISTASYSQNFSVVSQDSNPTGLFFTSDGTKMYITGNTSQSIYEYTLTTGFDLSTASYSSNSLNVSSEETAPRGVAFNSNGTKMFLVGPASDAVNEYTTEFSTLNDSTAYAMSLKVVQDSGASGYTVTWPTSVDWPAATAPTLTATASAVDQFVFYTYDGGTTWYGFTAGQALG